MKSYFRFVSAMLVILAYGSWAQAQFIVTVTPSVGPDAFAPSGNYNGYLGNAINALTPGYNTGTPSAAPPAAYSTTTNPVNASSGIDTPFSSWMGTAPGVGAFAAETGNSIYFGLSVTAIAGFTFQLADVSYAVAGNAGAIGNVNGAGNLQADFGLNTFNSVLVGVTSFGADGVAGGGDDTFLTTGTTIGIDLVGLYYTGVASGIDITADYPNYAADVLNGLTNQQILTNAINFFNTAGPGGGPVQISGSYSVVPEPASMAVLGLGMVGLLGYTYRRHRAVAPVAC